jgi:hypothetical protein
MYYVIQENVFKESHFDLLMTWIERNGIEYEMIKFRPFVTDLEFTTTRKDVWCWGSVSMSKIAKRYGWNPGSMYNKNHDTDVYGKYYGKHMLNHEGISMNLTNTLPDRFEYFFARPTKDTKSFSGQLFSREAWIEWVQQVINEETASGRKILTHETRVQIAPLKDIQQEVRCWVVGGRVVTASRYKLGSRVLYQNYDNETYFTDFAQKMVDIYQPAEAFVIDVCLANEELKVVEVNCINCSGYYHANMNVLMESIESYFS